MSELKTMAHLHNGIVHGPKKGGNLTLVTSWMDLEIIMLSEISQAEKDKYHMISHVASNELNKLTNKIETEVWTHGID